MAARSISTTASRCRASSTPPRAICATSRRRSISTCRKASRCCCRISPRSGVARKLLQPAQSHVLCRRRLSQHVADAIERIAVETTGERVMSWPASARPRRRRRPSRFWDRPRRPDRRAGARRRVEARAARRQARTACAAPTSRPATGKRRTSRGAFDDEGFYQLGDAVRSPIRPTRPRASSSTAASPRISSSRPAPGSRRRAARSFHRAFCALRARRGHGRPRP